MNDYLWIFLWLAISFAGSQIAKRKGRNAQKWFFYICLTFTTALFVLIFLPPLFG